MPQNGITPQDDDVDALAMVEDPDDDDMSDDEFLDDMDVVLSDEWP
ncbi:hypothetical protein [Streptacidiphilus neutrinimicus]|nr:hypothetical protein [Streptacidiphilus neutrinimicus]